MKLAGIALVVSAMVAAAPVPPKEIRKTVSLAEGKRLFLESEIGDVTIRPGAAKQAEVAARIVADGDCADNKDRVAKTDVLVEAIPEGLRVRTVRDASSQQNLGMLRAFIKTCEAPRVHYTLSVPRTTKLDLRVDRSTVDVQDMDGGLNLRMRYGKISAQGLAGGADVDMRGGETRIGFRKLDQPVRVLMFSGILEASVPKDAKFDLNYEVNPHRLESDFPAGRVNGGGPRLDLRILHGLCRIKGTVATAPERRNASPHR